MEPALRVVAPGEQKQREKHTVTTAADRGDHLDLLIAMRARVAKAVENSDTPARDLASLTRRLMEIAKEIEVLQAAADEEEGQSGRVEDEAFDASAI